MQAVPQQSLERKHDADLSQLDKVMLMLDLDRDYNSAIRFGIAETGDTSDQLDSCNSFNPKWHLKVARLGNNWIAEGAIGLHELGTAEPLDGKTWAMCAARQNEFKSESWSRLRSTEVQLQAAGILHFLPRAAP